MENDIKLYNAIIWKRDSESPGKRVSVVAESLSEAKRLLEAEHGEGNIFDLHNEEDAARPR